MVAVARGFHPRAGRQRAIMSAGKEIVTCGESQLTARALQITPEIGFEISQTYL
ncbi:MAG: hypothetical protein IPL71_18850 [Anaerolineales bacterium]|uniref:hypothetical protein n=1 Tax=Candidatus Villigracilis proximus TaxID=3140683 RepID=UPI003135013F|nr:hypothetical protein [Anaerolineales bacterium]